MARFSVAAQGDHRPARGLSVLYSGSHFDTEKEGRMSDPGKVMEERVSRDTEYEAISRRTGDVWSSNHDATKLFIQTYSAILGGSFWLRSQGVSGPDYWWASSWLVLGLAILCIIMLWDNQGSWSQWRTRLEQISVFATIQIPPTHARWRRVGMEAASSALIMVVAVGVFAYYNPFSQSAFVKSPSISDFYCRSEPPREPALDHRHGVPGVADAAFTCRVLGVVHQ